jgi:cell division protein FtsL
LDTVATKKSDRGTGVFLAHLAVVAVMVVVLATSFIVYVETLWMKGEIKKEAKELRKLKEEVKEKLK